MPDTARLLAAVGPGLFQQAFVVADLDAAQDAMRTALGCREFATLPAMDLDYDVRGEQTSCALALAFARSGDVQIELIQPVRGAGLHVEFLADRGSGAHHLGFMVDDLDATVALAERCSIAKVMAGAFGRLRFAYLDTWNSLSLYAEVVEDPDGTMMQIMPWR